MRELTLLLVAASSPPPGHHLPGRGIETVWPQFLAVAAIGLAFFAFSIGQFRKSIAVTR